MTTPPQLLPAPQVNTVAARVARRRAFRLAFQLARDARSYTPRPYVNEDVPDDYRDGGLTQPIDPGDGERAGSHHATDPS